eukprot:3015566-Pleurochrysis_carterae.AAC.5
MNHYKQSIRACTSYEVHTEQTQQRPLQLTRCNALWLVDCDVFLPRADPKWHVYEAKGWCVALTVRTPHLRRSHAAMACADGSGPWHAQTVPGQPSVPARDSACSRVRRLPPRFTGSCKRGKLKVTTS